VTFDFNSPLDTSSSVLSLGVGVLTFDILTFDVSMSFSAIFGGGWTYLMG
jgi:hypothetical protein